MPAHAPLNSCLSVDDREARADGERGKLIDRVAAGALAGKLLFVEALGHMRVPFAANGPDHRTGVELAAIDAHRAAEAAADIERRFDDGVPGETPRNRLEIGDFPGQAAAAIPFLFLGSSAKCKILYPISVGTRAGVRSLGGEALAGERLVRRRFRDPRRRHGSFFLDSGRAARS